MAQYTGLKSILTKLVVEIKTSFLDLSHPIGSYFWTSTSTFDPNESFGGSWERVKSKFIYAAGDDDTVGDTGGSKNVTLSTSNLPSHSHTINHGHGNNFSITSGGTHYHNKASTTSGPTGLYLSTLEVGGTTFYTKLPVISDSDSSAWIGKDKNGNCDGSHSHSLSGGVSSYSGSSGNTGSGNSFSIMPPYEVAYCWKRIS